MLCVPFKQEIKGFCYVTQVSLQFQNLWYLQRIKVFSGPKNVVISSKKYDIHRLNLNLDILNKSQVDANMKNWQIYGNLNFCDYIYISAIWGEL
jgi:hypothetical protein